MEDGGGCGDGGGSDGCSSDGGAANGGDSAAGGDSGDSASYLSALAERIGEPDVFTPTVDVTGERSQSRSEGIRRQLRPAGSKSGLSSPSPGVFTPIDRSRLTFAGDDGVLRYEQRRAQQLLVDEYERTIRKRHLEMSFWIMTIVLGLASVALFWFYFGR